MDHLMCTSLSHTHYWYEVGMLKVPAVPVPLARIVDMHTRRILIRLILMPALAPLFRSASASSAPFLSAYPASYSSWRRPTDPQEGLGWYLLGRCYMAAQKHELAYQAYEQAV